MLKDEWKLLQTQFEESEKWALIIKISAVALTITFFLSPLSGLALLALILVLWFMEGMWKTYQSRLAERLLVVESFIQQGLESEAMKLHSDWKSSRPDNLTLVMEYVSNSLKPTVAFPYAPLILIAIIL